ncbi:MAG: hypothetical protein ACLR0N_09615 [Bilophila wadsworthia]
MLISERLLTPEERKAKAKRDSFARALCESYHYVVDVDLGTGHFELLANRNDLATALRAITPPISSCSSAISSHSTVTPSANTSPSKGCGQPSRQA